MEKKKDFLQEIVNLSDKDLKRIYEMTCQKIKEGRLNGEDISLYEIKLEGILAELLRRTRSSSEKLYPNKMHPSINDPDKMHQGINDPNKMHPSINDPDKMHQGINDPDKMHPSINDPDKMHPSINDPNKDDEEER